MIIAKRLAQLEEQRGAYPRVGEPVEPAGSGSVRVKVQIPH